MFCYPQLFLPIYSAALLPSGNSEEDAYSIRKFVSDGNQIILGQSYAKNFGLYGERVGALSIVTASPEETGKLYGP